MAPSTTSVQKISTVSLDITSCAFGNTACVLTPALKVFIDSKAPSYLLDQTVLIVQQTVLKEGTTHGYNTLTHTQTLGTHTTDCTKSVVPINQTILMQAIKDQFSYSAVLLHHSNEILCRYTLHMHLHLSKVPPHSFCVSCSLGLPRWTLKPHSVPSQTISSQTRSIPSQTTHHKHIASIIAYFHRAHGSLVSNSQLHANRHFCGLTTVKGAPNKVACKSPSCAIMHHSFP